MNLLSCDEVQSSLIDFIEFELPIWRRQQFNEHIKHCDQCRELHDDMQTIMIDSKNIEIKEPGEQFWRELPNNVLKEVKQRERERNHKTVASSALLLENVAGGFVNKLNNNDNNVLPFKAPAQKLKPLNSEKRPEKRSEKRPAHPARKSVDLQPEYDQPLPDLEHDIGKEAEKPYSKTTWPKFALPIAASLVLAIGSVFVVTQSTRGPSSDDSVMFYNSVAAQTQIAADAAVSDQELARLAQTIVPINHQSARLGFASQHTILNTFSIGALFAESIVYMKSNDVTLVKTHLALLNAALQQKTGSKSFVPHIQRLQAQIQHGTDTTNYAATLNQLMNRYAAFLKSTTEEAFILFQAGAWSYDLALAALAKGLSLREQLDEIKVFKTQLRYLGAPAGVTKSLDSIAKLLANDRLSDRDYQKIIHEVDNIRSLLG